MSDLQMNDREIVELAASAMGFEGQWNEDESVFIIDLGSHGHVDWNPLADDLDAFRLMVALKLDCLFDSEIADNPGVEVLCNEEPAIDEVSRPWACVLYGEDERAATRRALSITAAKLGRLKSF